MQILRGGAAELARKAGCSTAHLSRTMHACLGLTPSEWLMSQRMNRATQLLEATSLSILEVAGESGFENLSHFHRSFRRVKGETPLQYRKQHSRAMM